MIIVYHKNNKVTEVGYQEERLSLNDKLTVAQFIMQLAENHPDELLVWCHSDLKKYLNSQIINSLFTHKKLLLSFNPAAELFLGRSIGYVEESPFINVNFSVAYPTWQMSSAVGAVNTAFLKQCGSKISTDTDFDYFLNSLAKITMPSGLLCYSEPRLLKRDAVRNPQKSNNYNLFRFVKQHYRTRWIFLLFFNLMIYERRFPVLPLLFSCFYKKRSSISFENFDLSPTGIENKTHAIINTVDVIIPTIGRKKYIYDVLLDLKSQSHLPKNIIIVEQNPENESKSELDFITAENWPFTINHIFTHQAGACNARNIALEKTTADWIFLADDDIRFQPDFIQSALGNVLKFDAKAVSFSCLQKNEKRVYKNIFQWNSFGSGCSFIYRKSAENCKFRPGFEFGFGEDADFGMQLRNHGCDILYLPVPEILHLKAPVGGFRTKPELKWAKDEIQPKPSPTVMLFFILNYTKEQLCSYKTTLFFKYYKHQKIGNPFKYFGLFQKQWKQSIYWANELKNL